MLKLDPAPLEELMEAATENLIAQMTRGNLDEKGKRFHEALREMVSFVALAKFDGRLPTPPARTGE